MMLANPKRPEYRQRTYSRGHRSQSLRVVEDTEVRPKQREDCKQCDVCQAWRDSGFQHPGQLPCGHAFEESVMHTRPCVFAGCKHQNYLDVVPVGRIRFNQYGVEIDGTKDSCTLDVADESKRKQVSLSRVGRAMGLQPTAVANIEKRALQKLEKRMRRWKREQGDG